jgi:hypothetical protein
MFNFLLLDDPVTKLTMVKDDKVPPETEKAEASEPMEVEPMKGDPVKASEGASKEEEKEKENEEAESMEEDEEEEGGDGGGTCAGGGGCTADPNFAVICSFIDKFGASCGIPCPNIGELQVCIYHDYDLASQFYFFLVPAF